MEKHKTADAYYATEHPFQGGINALRNLAKQTEAIETCKWGMPVYTINNKNVFGISRFKNHFGIWFFNGAFMDDPKKVLQNAQEGKTKGMRQWRFESQAEIDGKDVLVYLNNAIQKQKDGKVLPPSKPNRKFEVPEILKNALEKKDALKTNFKKFSPYKQKEFCEYIAEAKQEKTKIKRLEKILPMIAKGIGLNDAYR